MTIYAKWNVHILTNMFVKFHKFLIILLLLEAQTMGNHLKFPTLSTRLTVFEKLNNTNFFIARWPCLQNGMQLKAHIVGNIIFEIE